MTLGIRNWLCSGHSVLLLECLIWALVAAAIHAGIATVADWDRFEPEGFAEYWYIIAHRWDFVPEYVLWIGLPLIVTVWAYSRTTSGRRPRARHGGDEYRIFDQEPSETRSSIATFACLYLGAMFVAGLGRTAIVQCLTRGECGFFTWYQGILYSAVFLIWPLVLLLLQHALWRAIRRR